MNKLLMEFLSINKKISVPGIGAFSIVKENTNDRFVMKTIAPTLDTIEFRKELNEDAQNKFEHYAIEKQNISSSEIEAIYQQLTDKLNNTNRLNLGGLGVLTKEGEQITFQQTFSTADFYPEIIVEKVIRENAEHTITVGEQERTNTEMREMLAKKSSPNYWWVYVLIGVIICGAAYFFYKNYFEK